MDEQCGSLQGRLALITGASRGIGAAIARRLHLEGAEVILVARDRESLRVRSAELPGSSVRAADVTDARTIAELFDSLEDAPDIVVNNAGAASSSKLHRTSDEAWNAMLAVNLTGVFSVCRSALPGMLERGTGRIVNVASTAALRGYPYVSAYCAAKHGVLGLTRALALELAHTEITVNAVCPGFTETEMLQRSIDTIRETTGRTEEQARRALLRDNPQGRFVTPEEVADAVAWLVSDGAAAITGQAIAVSGGEVT